MLGIPLIHGNKCTDNSPTLDKIIPSLGYVSGNIWIISHRANTIKSDASIDELLILAKRMTEKRIEQLNLELDKVNRKVA